MPYNELEKIADEAVSRVTGESVLDVGTGFGIVVSRIISRDGCSLVSVDPEAWTFDDLREKYSTEIEGGRLKLFKQGIENLSFGDGAFDTSISISAIHHFSDPVAGIKSMERVTRGRVIVADWNEDSAGVTNPHKPEDLKVVKEAAMDYLQKNSYNILEDKYWFMGWKDVSR